MWVYKHDLFQREKPELLHLVRRRTCPGNDKRKQRLPRQPKENPKANDSDDEDDASSEASPVAVQQPVEPRVVFAPSRKRTMTVSDFEKPRGTKRSTPEPSPAVVVDATMLRSLSTSAVSEESDDQASATKVNEAEQSAIVSDVASQLAKYARMAQKGSSGRSSRRSGSGMVTPPNFKTSSGNLLTYDDECVDEDIKENDQVPAIQSTGSNMTEDSPHAKGTFMPEPVSFDVAQAIIKSIVDNSAGHPERETLVSAANVACFCMAATPSITAGTNLLCRKILDLFLQSESLAQEFLYYRSALYPLQNDDIRSGFSGPEERQNGGLSTKNIWERVDRRGDALREFSVFAVNRIFMVMDFSSESGVLPEEATALLEQTAAVWQKLILSTE